MILKDEMGRIWKEAIVACAKELSQHLPNGTEEHRREPHSGWPAQGQGANSLSEH
jgi:hypothetical protein